ncbi:ADF-H domain-containing protein [Entamoeba marina]
MVDAAMKRMNSLDVPHGEYVIMDYDKNKLVFRKIGNGITNLKNDLQDNQVSFALLCIRLELQGIPDQPRLVFMHWKGPNVSGMVKVKANQFVQQALDTLAPNHGQLEVVGKTEFTEKNISEKWKPSAGSHVIN